MVDRRPIPISWKAAAVFMASCLLLTGQAWSQQSRGATSEETPAQLVRLAMEKELAGQDKERESLLRKALVQAPDYAEAHWQLGYVRTSGVWMSPYEVARAAQNDPRLAQYARLRDAAGRTAADQAALARWCRKNRLDDQQRAHWQMALQLQPDNAEAIAALKLRSYCGTLMTAAQIQQGQRQMRETAKAADRWRPLVAKWRAAAERGDAALPAAMREKIVTISDPAEMLGLERTLWQQAAAKRKAYRPMLLALMPALGENPRPVAAASLARYAVFGVSEDVRQSAVYGLKRHPLEHYAMLLLGGLESPLEGKVSVSGPSLYCSVYQEGATADVSLSLSYSYQLAVLPSHIRFDDGSTAAAGDLAAFQRQVQKGSITKCEAAQANAAVEAANANDLAAANRAALEQAYAMNRLAGDFQDAVDRSNEAIRKRNARITAALRGVTGFDGGDEPMDWWKWWWEDYNEMYKVGSRGDSESSDQPSKPVYEYSSFEHHDFLFGGHTSVVPCSCFAPGTMVWTLTGRQPIERIKIGDRVLAQDIETGELAYKAVLAVTIRPPGDWMKIGMGKEEITTTPSHPFWVSGQGWRMSKQLEAGRRLHSLSGGVLVDSIEDLGRSSPLGPSAYNLIVADYNDYFVGNRGILVHDNTPRKPTAARLPGLACQEVTMTNARSSGEAAAQPAKENPVRNKSGRAERP